MAPTTSSVLAQIDAVLQQVEAAKRASKYDDLSDLHEDLPALVSTLYSTIRQLAPPGTGYYDQAQKLFSEQGMENAHVYWRTLVGILKALRKAYESNYLQSIQELVHADLFADFLEMASYLISQGFKDPAAVIAGGTLEESLRKLCGKFGVSADNPDGSARKSSSLNDDLAKAGAYDKLEQKSVTAWLDLRNKAAHGKYAEYDRTQVESLILGIRGFLQRNPA